ncbi:MAG TPA: hypothetical protein VFW33_07645 [Gemmataceae bacterium]|nr:hypothetical protein [Gemmataceae bacterium]
MIPRRNTGFLANSLRTALTAAGFLLVFTAVGGEAFALPPAAPETDPGSAVGAVTLLVGGLLLLAPRVFRNEKRGDR